MTKAQIKKRLLTIDADIHTAIQAIDDLAQEMRDYYDERTEKWQESDKGSAYSELIDTIEEYSSEIEQTTCPDVD